jgi:hypothetical protein
MTGSVATASPNVPGSAFAILCSMVGLRLGVGREVSDMLREEET